MDINWNSPLEPLNTHELRHYHASLGTRLFAHGGIVWKTAHMTGSDTHPYGVGDK